MSVQECEALPEDYKELLRTLVKKNKPSEKHAAFEALADQYEKSCETRDLQGALKTVDVLETRLSSVESKEKLRVIDIGCGPGRSAVYLQKKYPALREKIILTGGDYSENMLKAARKNAVFDEIMTVDVQSDIDPALAGTFDGIICAALFVPNQVDDIYITNVLDFLKPGGVAAVSYHASYWEEHKDKIVEHINSAGCVLEDEVDAMYAPLSGTMGKYLVIRKME